MAKKRKTKIDGVQRKIAAQMLLLACSALDSARYNVLYYACRSEGLTPKEKLWVRKRGTDIASTTQEIREMVNHRLHGYLR